VGGEEIGQTECWKMQVAIAQTGKVAKLKTVRNWISVIRTQYAFWLGVGEYGILYGHFNAVGDFVRGVYVVTFGVLNFYKSFCF